MNTIEQLQQASSAIDDNISALQDNYGLMSQNILAQLRNLVEGIAIALYDKIKPYYEYNDISNALRAIDKIKEYKYIFKFYKQLEIVASHYTLDAVNSEHLVYYYFSYLTKIKQTVREKLGIDILKNITQMVRSETTPEYNHCEEILSLSKSNRFSTTVVEKRRLYVTKQRPIVVNNEVIYESVLSISKTRSNKSDGVLVYSKFELPEHYAIKIKYCKEKIIVNSIAIPITIVTACCHSIYPRELNLLGRILGKSFQINHNSSSYKRLMSILDESYSSLLDIIDDVENYFVDSNDPVRALLLECKLYLKTGHSGNVILRYLIHTLNYDILYKQYQNSACKHLSGLHLKFGCIPFDQMPFCTSLIGHNPTIAILLECIDYHDREHEFLCRFLQNKASQDNQLYILPEELLNFKNVDSLVARFNNQLYYRHKSRSICRTLNNCLYIREYEESLKFIINALKKKCAVCIKNHEAFVENWLSTRKDSIDSEEKKIILKKLFSNSQLSLIVGPAGTGKTTLINYISELYNYTIINYLANTNAAVENIKRKVPNSTDSCSTITSFLHKIKNTTYKCNILIIDECSTIPNHLMVALLKSVEYDCIVLVGDDFQLGSIEYGNWFAFAQNLLPRQVIHELKDIYRSANPDLRLLWDKVRKLDSNISSYLGKVNGSSNLDASVYSKFSNDQIVLNLNYDGMYGINNINAIMQGQNNNESIQWGVHTYKVGDPIIFVESSRFENIFYNNLKGKITRIHLKASPRRVAFDVEIDRVLTSMFPPNTEYEIIQLNRHSTEVRFEVYEPSDSEDADSESCIVPFVISYATSIHKSQGLEYESVKIIITEDNIKNITHDIFYTALTRAKDKLTIYWTKETEQAVIRNLSIRNINRDLNIFRLNTSS